MCVCVCVHNFKHEYLCNQLGPNATKFDLKHHFGGGNDALGFGLDRIRTLVFIATDRSHRVIMGENVVNTLAPSFLIRSSLF